MQGPKEQSGEQVQARDNRQPETGVEAKPGLEKGAAAKETDRKDGTCWRKREAGSRIADTHCAPKPRFLSHIPLVFN